MGTRDERLGLFLSVLDWRLCARDQRSSLRDDAL